MNTEQVGSSFISVPSNNNTEAPELIPRKKKKFKSETIILPNQLSTNSAIKKYYFCTSVTYSACTCVYRLLTNLNS